MAELRGVRSRHLPGEGAVIAGPDRSAPPAKRALVICSGWDPVPAMINSAACAEQMLRAWGFEVTRCDAARATRQGILDAYDHLIASSRATDAAVVYYTGHGNLVVNSQYAVDAGLPSMFRNVCPTDFAQTRDGDFHGISSYELSLQLAALTARTQNATVILECCYAAQMSRGDDASAPPPPSPQVTRVGVTAHLQALRDRLRGLAVGGNPDAIRIVAAGEAEAARFVRTPEPEVVAQLGLHDLPSGEAIGAMTFALARLLADTKDRRVPWRAIAPLLRERLIMQRPEIEGPISRLPFSLDVVDAVVFAVRGDPPGAILEAGALLGVSNGDVYGVMPAGSTQIAAERLIATATIEDVTALQSRASRLAWCNGYSVLPVGAIAMAISIEPSPYPVCVVAPPAVQPLIEARLRTTGRLRSTRTADETALATIRIDRMTVELRDDIGTLVPPTAYPAQIDSVVNRLVDMATVKRLRSLGNAGLAKGDVTVVVGVVGSGGAFHVINDGDAVGLGDRVAVRLTNHTARPLWANAFNVGIRGSISRLDGAASGIALPANQSVQLGDNKSGTLVGYSLGWPDGLPRDRPRLDTVMTIVTAKPADLSMLETIGRLVAVRGRDGLDTDFAIIWRDYLLQPIDGSLDLGPIGLDASPIEDSAGGDLITEVALARLEVAPAKRVDILVCARPQRGAAYQATTQRGPGDAILWSGAARSPIDVYLWTSQERGDSRPLVDRLAMRPIGAAVGMLGSAGSLLAHGASLQLASIARAGLGDPPTVFRGSFGTTGSSRFSTADVSFTLAIK
jgi:hypothetical protein